jgi:hypothetical protein
MASALKTVILSGVSQQRNGVEEPLNFPLVAERRLEEMLEILRQAQDDCLFGFKSERSFDKLRMTVLVVFYKIKNPAA